MHTDESVSTTYISDYAVSWCQDGIKIVIQLIIDAGLHRKLYTPRTSQLCGTSPRVVAHGTTNYIRPTVDIGSTLTIQLSGDSTFPTVDVVLPSTTKYISLYTKIDIHNEVVLWLKSKSLVSVDVNMLHYIVLLQLWEDELNHYASTLSLIQLPALPIYTGGDGITYTLPIPVEGYDGGISFEVSVQLLQDALKRRKHSVYITLFMVVEVDAHLNEDGLGVTGKIILYNSNLELEGNPITLQTIRDTVHPHIYCLATSMKAATTTLTLTLDNC